jgi:hypothetical protein
MMITSMLRNQMGSDNFDWFAQNPHNLYECQFCGQWDKGHDDPRNDVDAK